ncbi:hypothetical protein WA026_010252 [Henosepilachna vigintioctopunctata]|uniref:Uncharacterized protein n=1 Tax=Henosepilachna vigintioctopunctata TaxID=420089 RepID=A0AAW1UJS7_9CUCU
MFLLNLRSSSEEEKSLDWDSPSIKTGTVKRRPVSCDNPLSLGKNSIESQYESKPSKKGYHLPTISIHKACVEGGFSKIPTSVRRQNIGNNNGIEESFSCSSSKSENLGKSLRIPR